MRQVRLFLHPKGVSVSQVLRFGCLLVAIVLLGTTPASAQFSDGKIVGTVYDTSKAAIPGATLQLDNSFGSGLQVLLGTNYQGTQPVHVVASTPSGSLGSPRTAAQDICS